VTERKRRGSGALNDQNNSIIAHLSSMKNNEEKEKKRTVSSWKPVF